MQSFYDYDVIIFDCDGVILDSNNLKIKAMEAALLKSNFPKNKIKKSIKFFNDNFGMSRFYHVDYFVEVLNGDCDLEEAREDLQSLIDEEKQYAKESFE